ncbi:MAG: AmmeMemoRadiSam system radical SAM enzyme [archaeon]
MQEKEALYYRKLKNKTVQCQLCPKFCTIKNGERGNCNVRENQEGILRSIVYGKLCSMNPDPIEKKPLYHFMPGQQAMSIATVGCNLHCQQCQNWQISQERPEYYPSITMSPEEIVQKTIDAECSIIAYTYTEPTVFYEYMLDTAKIAREKGIKNVLVSNGFINPEPLNELCRYIDAANIDLKSISEKFYRKICDGSIEPVLDSIKMLHKNKIWLELTNLIIPKLNDSEEEIKELAGYIAKIDKNIPLHLSAFHPTFKMANLQPTPEKTIIRAKDIALRAGLKYVYTGNINDSEANATCCPKCKKQLIIRQGYFVFKNYIEKGRCRFCNEKIAGIFN